MEGGASPSPFAPSDGAAAFQPPECRMRITPRDHRTVLLPISIARPPQQTVRKLAFAKRAPFLFTMQRLLALFLAFLFSCALARADSPALTLTNDRLPSPAGVGARVPVLATALDGTVHLVWVESAPDGKEEVLRHASLARDARLWSEPHTVTRAVRVAQRDNALRLMITDAGTVVVLWLERPAAKGESALSNTLLCFSRDAGRRWSEPEPLRLTGTQIRNVTITALPKDRAMVAWITRDPTSGNDRLLSRTFGIDQPANEDAVVDASVFPGEAPALVAFPDDTATITYRALDRSLNSRRYREGAWSSPTRLEPAGVPLPPAAARSTGSILNGSTGRAAAAWLSFAENTPRLLVASSSNAGQSFFMPVRVDDDHPLGTPALARLSDHSLYVAWLENHPARTPSLWVRRIAAEGELSVPVLIDAVPKTAQIGSPQLALAKDDDSSPAQLLIVHTSSASGAHQVVTRLLTLPAAESLRTGRPCLTCPPSGDSQPGHAIRGRIVQLDPARLTVTLQHKEIPGVMSEGTRELQVDADTFATLHFEMDVHGRTEERAGTWRLFAVSAIKRPL